MHAPCLYTGKSCWVPSYSAALRWSFAGIILRSCLRLLALQVMASPWFLVFLPLHCKLIQVHVIKVVIKLVLYIMCPCVIISFVNRYVCNNSFPGNYCDAHIREPYEYPCFNQVMPKWHLSLIKPRIIQSGSLYLCSVRQLQMMASLVQKRILRLHCPKPELLIPSNIYSWPSLNFTLATIWG